MENKIKSTTEMKDEASKSNNEPNEQRDGEQFDDDDPRNFIPFEKGPGSLLRTKIQIEHAMKIKDRSFVTLKPGENVLTIHDFINPKTGERALILLFEEAKYIYMTHEIDKEFEIVFNGTSNFHQTEEIAVEDERSNAEYNLSTMVSKIMEE